MRIVIAVQQTFCFETNASKLSLLPIPTYLSKRLYNDFIKYAAISCSSMMPSRRVMKMAQPLRAKKRANKGKLQTRTP